MKHSSKLIPSFKTLSVKDKIAFCWYKIFVDNSLKWILWSFIFQIKCKILDIQCHGIVRCYGDVDISRAPGSTIVFGKNVRIVSDSSRSNASTLYSKTRIRTYTPTAKIEIGEGTGLNGVSITARTRSIIIGKNCRIAPNVVMIDSDYHAILPANSRADNPGFENDCDIIIGSNVWIGMRTIILKGVSVGCNSVIGAGSVVTRDIPENCIAAGNPVRIMQKLQDVETS